MGYTAPIKDMKFVLEQIAGIEKISSYKTYEHATSDVVEAVLLEAARLSSEVWAETNKKGDQQASKIVGDGVKTPDGFKDAFKQFAEGGWGALTCNPAHGGQGLPHALGMAVNEMWQSANLALSLCPLLTAGAIEAIEQYASPELKELYLPKLISGEWTATMNLTEPQAGTDLAAIRTIAKKTGDHYLMSGQKIYITFGEHDFTPNIIHLVLARVDGLPEGNDGLGLFIVPKFLADGRRNDVRAASLEHKLGIHGSPTCVMMYGEKEGAVAYLVGEEGKGLRNMFTMMNAARIGVGLQGVAVAEAAYQHALWYAKDRVQSPKLGDKSGKRVAIIEHADVRRMLLTMKANTEAARALAYYAGAMIDTATGAEDEAVRVAANARVDLLTPMVKAWSTDLGVETTSTAVQVFGGMGFVEETGAAQFYRDARILPIYEGTNGIQANDMVFRKVLRDGGAEAKKMMQEISDFIGAKPEKANDDIDAIQASMKQALVAVTETTDWLLANAKANTDSVAASAVPYLRQFSMLAGGYMMAKLAYAAHATLFSASGDADFYNGKLITARFFAEGILPQVHGLTSTIMGGCATVNQMANEQF